MGLRSHAAMYIITITTYFISLLLILTQEVSCARIYDPVGHNITKELIEMTQESLLRAFGHDMKRKPSKGFTPHEYMIDVYRKLSRDSDVSRRSQINTVRGIMDTDTGKEALFRLPHQVYHFDISGIPTPDKLLGCEFRILWKPSGLASRLRRNRSLRRKFYKLVVLGVSPRTSPLTNSSVSLRVDRLASHTFRLNERMEKWISFNRLLRFAQRLKSSNVNVMKLAIYVMEINTGRIISPTEIGFEKIGRKDKERGLLVLFSDNGRNKNDVESSKGRSKRGARRGRKKDRKSNSRRRNKALCRRRKMYVNFDDFGWTNWIIAPKGYDAYYCRGSCAFPIPGHLSPTSHAVIQSTISSMDSDFIDPACCIPDKLKSIAMLYLDNNDRVVYQKKEDMVVVSCACR